MFEERPYGGDFIQGINTVPYIFSVSETTLVWDEKYAAFGIRRRTVTRHALNLSTRPTVSCRSAQSSQISSSSMDVRDLTLRNYGCQVTIKPNSGNPLTWTEALISFVKGKCAALAAYPSSCWTDTTKPLQQTIYCTSELLNRVVKKWKPFR